MKILHLMLSCFYIDNVNYQENILPRYNKNDGHIVKIIASTETFINNTTLGYVKPRKYVNEDGIDVIRIPYRKILPHFIMKKVRSYSGVYNLIDEFHPDVILSHGVPCYELLTIIKYKKNNPNVKLYLDGHEDFHNSARNVLSRIFLHFLFYGPIIRKSLNYIEKILCISLETVDFLHIMYKIPFNLLEFYPLGGEIYDDDTISFNRDHIREMLQIGDNDILFIHSGKMNSEKKTIEVLEEFGRISNSNFKLCLIGELCNDIKSLAFELIDKDNRVKYLGWMNGKELSNYLCAADVYLQPGTQSATLQIAICCGCAVIIYPYKSHKPYLQNNGFYVRNKKELVNAMKQFSENPEIILNFKHASIELGKEILDYRKLAARLYR